VTVGADGDGAHNATSDDAEPVAADIPTATPVAKPPPHRPTIIGRMFGGLLAFLSLWQVLTPSNASGAVIGFLGLVVSVLWFVPCPRYFRLLATAALFALIVVDLRTAPAYVPRHERSSGTAGALSSAKLWLRSGFRS
jgi:hypothetical protein